MLIINRRKRNKSPLLFPGYKLGARVTGWKECCTLTGSIFESMTEWIMVGGEEFTTNSQVECCPDVVNEDEMEMVESKASNISSQFKVTHHQINDYMQAREEGWKVVYAFWMYGAKQLVKTYSTYHKIIKAVVGSVQYLDILDITIVDAIRRYEIDENMVLRDNDTLPGVRTILNWGPKEKFEHGAPNPMTLLSKKFFAWLRGDPDTALKALGLKHKAYNYHGEGQLFGKAEYNGVQFDTGSFVCWQIGPAEEDCSVPF